MGLTQPRILIVDDDPDVLVVLGDLLESLGYLPVRVGLGADAIGETRAHDYDLVLLDLSLPDVPGVDVLSQIKQYAPETEVIVVTGHRSVDSAVVAVRLRAFDYIEKPFGLAALGETIERALEWRRQRLEEHNQLDQLVRSERELREAIGGSMAEMLSKQRLLEAIVQECPDAILVADRERSITYVNDAAVRLVGVPLSEMVGTPIDGVVQMEGRVLDELLGGRDRIAGVDAVILNQCTSSAITVEASLSALRDEDGHPVGMIGVYRDVTQTRALVREVDEANQKLQALSITDPVTGLFNHRHFQAMLRTECDRARRYGAPVSLVMLDLDHFKLVNDGYGHTYGDEVLRRAAQEIRDRLRSTDTPCRYGGDEFAIIMPSTGPANAAATAERVRAGVEQCMGAVCSGTGPRVSFSIGVAAFPDDAATCEELIAISDQALYRAKAGGRNRVVVASDITVPC